MPNSLGQATPYEIRLAVMYAYNRRGQGDEAALRREGLALAMAGRLDDEGNVRQAPSADPEAAAMAMRLMDPTGLGGDPSLLEGVPDADVWTGRAGDVRDVYTDPSTALQRAIGQGQATMSELGPAEGGRAAAVTRGMEATFDAAMSPEFMAATVALPLAGGAVNMTRAAVLAKYPDMFAKAASLPAVRAPSAAEIAAMRTKLKSPEWVDRLKIRDLATWQPGPGGSSRMPLDAYVDSERRRMAQRAGSRTRMADPASLDPVGQALSRGSMKAAGMSPAQRANIAEELKLAARRGAIIRSPTDKAVLEAHARLSPAELSKLRQTYGTGADVGPTMRGPLEAYELTRTDPWSFKPLSALGPGATPMQYGGITDPRLAQALAPPTGMALGAIKMFQEEQARMSDRERTIDRQAVFRSAEAAIKRIRAAGEELPTNLQVAEVDPERYYALTKMYGPAMGDNDILDGTAEWVMAGNPARYAPAEDWYAQAMSGESGRTAQRGMEFATVDPRMTGKTPRMFPDPTTLEAVEAAPGPERSFEDIEAELAAEGERLRLPDPTPLEAVEAAPGREKSFEELQREVEEEGRMLNPEESEELLRKAVLISGPMEGLTGW